jgi:hypothetical protein
MTQPVRLQLSRRKGFDLQQLSQDTNGLPAVNVARPSKFGNPCRVGTFKGYDAARGRRGFPPLGRTRAHRFAASKDVYGQPPTMQMIRDHLRGKNLACFCKPGEPCHADVLLEIANR